MLGNLILENCNAPGTGALTPAGAPAGRQTFSGYFGAGVKCFYGITDGAQTEEGWTVTGSTLTRNVIWNTAGTTSPLNFNGSCQVYCTLPAQRAIWADETQTYQAQSRRVANLGSGLSAADAVRLDQVGWQQIGPRVIIGSSVGYPVGTVNMILPLPAGFGRYRLEWENCTPVTAGNFMIFRVSADGTNFFSGSGDYMQQSFSISGTATSVVQGDYSYIGVSPGLVTTAPCMGGITIVAQSDHSYELTSRGLLSVGPVWWSQICNGKITPNQNASNGAILLGMTAGYQTGTFRLLGGY